MLFQQQVYSSQRCNFPLVKHRPFPPIVAPANNITQGILPLFSFCCILRIILGVIYPYLFKSSFPTRIQPNNRNNIKLLSLSHNYHWLKIKLGNNGLYSFVSKKEKISLDIHCTIFFFIYPFFPSCLTFAVMSQQLTMKLAKRGTGGWDPYYILFLNFHLALTYLNW